MAYSLPVFNLAANIWRNANPVSNPPDVVSLANLALGRRAGLPLARTTQTADAQGGMWLLLPAGTDVRDGKAPAGPDTVEVAAGSGRYYDVVWVDDIGAGFANEHRFAEIVGRPTWPVPFPTATGVTPPPAPGVLATLNLISANATSSAFNPTASQFCLIVVGVTGPDPGPPFVSCGPFGALTPLTSWNRVGFAGQWLSCCAYIIGPGPGTPITLNVIPGFSGPALIQAVVYLPLPNNLGFYAGQQGGTTGSPWAKTIGGGGALAWYLWEYDMVAGASGSISYSGPTTPVMSDLVGLDVMSNPTRLSLWNNTISPINTTPPTTINGSAPTTSSLFISGGSMFTL